MSSTGNVAEFLRQLKLKRDQGEVIQGVWTDPKVEMVELTVTDLEEVLELAEQYEGLCE